MVAYVRIEGLLLCQNRISSVFQITYDIGNFIPFYAINNNIILISVHDVRVKERPFTGRISAAFLHAFDIVSIINVDSRTMTRFAVFKAVVENFCSATNFAPVTSINSNLILTILSMGGDRN